MKQRTRCGQTISGRTVYMIPIGKKIGGKNVWVEFDIKKQRVINPDIEYILYTDICKTCSSLFLRKE